MKIKGLLAIFSLAKYGKNEKLALFSIGTFFIRSSIIKRFEDHGSVPDRAVAVVFPLLAGIFSKVRYFSRKGNSG